MTFNILKKIKKRINLHTAVCQKSALTLAELLIALAITGVVVAITLPSTIVKTQEREFSQAINLFHYNLNEAMNGMQQDGVLTGYDTPEKFVRKLKQYLKIESICDSSELAKCFPEKIYNGDEEITLSQLIQGRRIVSPDRRAGFSSNNVGITLPNGSMAILNYDKNCQWKSPSNAHNSGSHVAGILSVGNVESTECIAILLDVNGRKKPNRIGRDIFIHRAQVGFGGIEVGNTGIIIQPFDTAYSPLNCKLGSNSQYCAGSTQYSNDYWAGANKACQEAGGRLPTDSEYRTIANYVENGDIQNKLSKLGFSIDNDYWYNYTWTSSNDGVDRGNVVCVRSDGFYCFGGGPRGEASNKAKCVK